VVALDPAPTSLVAWSESLIRQSVAADAGLMTAMLAAAEELRGTLPTIKDTRVPEQPQAAPCLPSLRAPDRLWSLYADIRSATTPDERVAALMDLTWLQLPDGIDHALFDVEVGNRLVATPMVQSLEGFLTQPRRFGELREWMAPLTQDSGREALERQVQCLIRWLAYFLPQRYRLDRPRHTEVLTLVLPPGRA
jgi:hypothetical protein